MTKIFGILILDFDLIGKGWPDGGGFTVLHLDAGTGRHHCTRKVSEVCIQAARLQLFETHLNKPSIISMFDSIGTQ